MECAIYCIDLFVCLIILWTLITECVQIVRSGRCQADDSGQSKSFLKLSDWHNAHVIHSTSRAYNSRAAKIWTVNTPEMCQCCYCRQTHSLLLLENWQQEVSNGCQGCIYFNKNAL